MIRKARSEDIPEIRQFLQNKEEHGIIPRPLSYLYSHLRDYFIYRGGLVGPRIAGVAALHPCWDGVAEIRSLAVQSKRQRQGIGAMLIEECVTEAGLLGIRKVFLLTLIPVYFEQFEFKVVTREELPPVAWADCVNCIKFPGCNETPMIKTL